jgi:VWFA-related protein
MGGTVASHLRRVTVGERVKKPGLGSVATGLAIAGLLAGSGAAQQSRFASETRLVRLDVSVLDETKRPVRDLTAGNFRITEDGHPLVIRSFETVSMREDDRTAADSTVDEGPDRTEYLESRPMSAVMHPAEPSPTTAGPGRIMVVVMDDDMTPANPRWSQQAKAIVGAIIDRLGRDDRMAIQFTRVAAPRLELTTERAPLRAQVARFFAGGFLALPPTDSGADELPRYRRSIDALTFTVETLARLTDRQKVIVYVGPGVPVDQGAPARTAESSLTAHHGDYVLRMTDLFRDAERAHVAIYTFDPTGLDGLEDYAFDRLLLAAKTKPAPYREPFADIQDRLRTHAHAIARSTAAYASAVAEHTGGRALVRSDVFEPAVEQLFADTCVYYLIAVEPPGLSPDGRFHEVSVRVNRPGLNVRARRGYYYVP